MKKNRVLALLVLAALALAIPAAARVRSRAIYFRVTAPTPGAYANTVDVRWHWSGGSELRDNYVAVSTVDGEGNVQLIAPAVPIWHGGVTWETAGWDDGTYTVRALIVSMSSIRHEVQGVQVDNSAPAVNLTQPAAGNVMLNGSPAHTGAPVTVVAGPVTLEATATDQLSGVASIDFLVNGERVPGTLECSAATSCTATAQHEFGLGADHEVVAEACDAAGNCDDSAPLNVAVGAPTSPEGLVSGAGEQVPPVPSEPCVQDTCVEEPSEGPIGCDPSDTVCANYPPEVCVEGAGCTSLPDPACLVETTDPVCLVDQL